MNYINIPNFEKFQHYKDRRPTWIKLLIEIIDQFDAKGKPKKFFDLTDSSKLTFIALLCLRAHYEETIPYPSDTWLKQRLGLQKISLKPLIDKGFIVLDTESVPKPYKSGTPEREREREKEGEGDARIQFLDFVFLTKNEHDKLVSEYGEKITGDYIDRLNRYIGSRGVKYKSHYFTILNWLRRDKVFPPSAKSKNSDADQKERDRKTYSDWMKEISQEEYDDYVKAYGNGLDWLWQEVSAEVYA